MDRDLKRQTSLPTPTPRERLIQRKGQRRYTVGVFTIDLADSSSEPSSPAVTPDLVGGVKTRRNTVTDCQELLAITHIDNDNTEKKASPGPEPKLNFKQMTSVTGLAIPMNPNSLFESSSRERSLQKSAIDAGEQEVKGMEDEWLDLINNLQEKTKWFYDKSDPTLEQSKVLYLLECIPLHQNSKEPIERWIEQNEIYFKSFRPTLKQKIEALVTNILNIQTSEKQLLNLINKLVNDIKSELEIEKKKTIPPDASKEISITHEIKEEELKEMQHLYESKLEILKTKPWCQDQSNTSADQYEEDDDDVFDEDDNEYGLIF